MSDAPQGPGWWLASDGKWYAPDLHPELRADRPPERRDSDVERLPSTGTILRSVAVTAATSGLALSEATPEGSQHDSEIAAEPLTNGDGLPPYLGSRSVTAPVQPEYQAQAPQAPITQPVSVWTPRHDFVHPSFESPGINRQPIASEAGSALQPEHLRGRRRMLTVLAVVLLLGAGSLAVRENFVAGQWRRADQAQLANSQLLKKRLLIDQGAVETLDSHVSKLDGQITGLQSQLSSVATAKEKAIDQNAVLSAIATAAGSVSDQLSTCVDDLNQLLGEIGSDISFGNYSDPSLQSNADSADQVCATAQQDNGQIQTILSGG